MNSKASPSKRKPTKKKQITTKSPSKRSDIRVTSNRCGNYIPTPISSILDKLSQAYKNVKEKCYFCQYSLYNNCSILQRKSRLKTIECLAGWLDETPALPDIDLINNFKYELLLQYANCTSGSGFSSGKENNNSIQKDKKENEIPNNLQVNDFFENHLSEIENNTSIRNKNSVDDNVNIGDIQDKQYFVVEQEHDEDPKTKKTLEYFGLSCIEDMFPGSGDESDSTIIYSPNYPNYKVKSIYVISDSESDLEVNTNICNDGKSLRKRHINESDSEGPVYKSKKSGHQQMKRNTASTSSRSTSVYTHATYKNKARDVQTTEKRDSECDDKETVYESDTIVVLSNNSVKNISFVINERDSDSENRKLPREPNNESDSEGPMFKSVYTPIAINVIDSSSAKNSVGINTNESGIIFESSIVVSDNNRNLSNNTDMITDSKLLKKQNIQSFNKVQEVESASKEKTANVASFTINNSINIPFDDNDNDVLVIERNVSCTVIRDTESDSENNSDINTNSILQREKNNDSDNVCPDNESVDRIINTIIASFTSNEAITLPFDDNDNDVQVIEPNVPCILISDTDSDSENNTDINTNNKLQREKNNDSDNVCPDNESVDKIINTIIASFTSNETITLPFDDNDNDVRVIEPNVPCILISDTDCDSENNTDINTNIKLQRERNNNSNNECLESVDKIINTIIASFTANETITLPFVDNDNDVQVIEPNVPCILISDTDRDSENNTDINTNSKLQREKNNDSDNVCPDNESVDKIINTIIASFTSNETITLPFDDNDNDVQVIEPNVPCIIISDTDCDSENNTDINTNIKLQRERNNNSNNECLESVDKIINTIIASFTSNETITLPFDDNDNDVQVIETNVPCIFISDTDSDSENNTNMKTNGKLKLLRDQNNKANPEADDVSASNKVIATCVITDSDSDSDDGWLDQYLRY